MVRVVVIAQGAGPTGMTFRAQLASDEVSASDTQVGSIHCDTEAEASQVIDTYNAHPCRPSGGDISLSQVLDRVRGIE